MAVIITITCGFITGNRMNHIFLVSIIGSLTFGGFGLIIYMILEKKVPEFLEYLSGISMAGGFGMDSGDFSESGSSNSGDIKLQATSNLSSDMGGSGTGNYKEQVKDGKYGDTIYVNNIAFKNEPKLMAEAVRTILAQDEPETPQK